ncbi:beta-galactosidase GalB [Flavihumibacter solisilvae]|uniref:Beta-galactosidase n=1 Tax=Flavihumibacter solisilvae TaxID=1349421 RepID=A0A0C1KY58_9BACT|nr:beta-galactosidase GalB [Flavihumibacter solisilvae]KIC92632.1 beta-galactosidase [Flavihumibacter solisilvae]
MHFNKFHSACSLLILAFITTVSSNVFSQSHPIKRMGSLNTVSFDDAWLFARFGLQADGTRKEEPAGLESGSFNDAAWQKLSLPHDWAITGPFRIELDGGTGKLPWKGIGWYRKHFTIPAADANKKIFIDFDGAMANAKIWLNGRYVGTWPYGYTSFRMDLSPYIQPGKENVLAVRLDTEQWDSRWYPGAGIYRHVWLVKTDPVHVDHWGTYITTPRITEASADVNIAVTVRNHSKKDARATVRTELYELDAANKPTVKVAEMKATVTDLRAGEQKVIESQSTVNHPKRWDIETPNRYVAKTTISIGGRVIDTYHTPFGIRTLEFTARNGFLLNGKRVQIKGTCNHHDLGALGAAFNLSALTRQLKMLKEMGCNSLRTSHNPPAPELLELADKMGFLVWDEAFDAWKKGKRKNDYNQLFDQWHEKDLTALVYRDRNHPSVFIWSIGNEVMEQQDVALTKHLVDLVYKADPTRPVSNGYNDPDGGRNSGAAVALDIMGVNYFFGQQRKWDADPRYANKPTLGSETSSCVSSRGEYFFGTDEYKNWQISSYDYAKPGWGCSPDEQFRTNARYPHLLGEYVWTGFDYLGEPTPYNSDETNLLNFRTDPNKKAELERQLELIRKNNPPSRSSYFGIIDLAGFPKDRFYSYQSHWRPELPVAHIFPHWNWPERIDSITPVHVYTSGDEAELFLNGVSMGRKAKSAGKDYRLVWDSVRYQPGQLKVICYKDGKQWATDEVRTTGEMKKLEMSPDRTVIKAGEDELCFITVKVTDKDGLMVPRSHPVIHFSVEGAGEIVATDNGDATSFVPFQSHDRPAYNGMALLIIKAKKGVKGKVVVKASSDALMTGQTVVTVQ